jgi:hypothetical protein
MHLRTHSATDDSSANTDYKVGRTNHNTKSGAQDPNWLVGAYPCTCKSQTFYRSSGGVGDGQKIVMVGTGTARTLDGQVVGHESDPDGDKEELSLTGIGGTSDEGALCDP